MLLGSGFLRTDLLIALKIAILILESLYFIFSFVVVRQVTIMNRTFKNPYGDKFRFMAFFHMLVVLSLIIVSVIAL